MSADGALSTDSQWAAWIGKREITRDIADGRQARALAATLGIEGRFDPGDPLSELWYWIHFLPMVPMKEIGTDGHPRRGGFLPPIPLERRMWAGSRATLHDTFAVGESIEKTSTILKVAEKEGKAGKMAFVTIGHQVHAGSRLVAEEEQDLVFIAMPKIFMPPAPFALPDSLAWQESRSIDEVMLFRFSAVTFNGHRIHYDRPYATDVEMYPGLVVHGPLQALLLFETAKARNPGRRPARFTFRGLRPLFDFEAITLNGKARQDGGLDLFTANGEGHVGTQATIHWA
jgi:3-methylfumaryl-CoA hydratase